jgi:signal transduction histidine kinase
LRSSRALSLAGAGPTIAFMLGLPLVQFIMGGGQNSLDLMPLVGGLLLLGFGVNLWRSLLASDAAQAQAEAAAIRERQAAASAAAAKTDMIRRMNDELRTPMAALIGAAEHLHRAAASPQARAHIATLVQAGEVLKLVLDDLSDLDRLENGKLPIEPRPVDPREVVRGVVAAFRAAAQDKQIELFLDIAPDAPPLVAIDPARVRQVLFNLLANAVRYTAHGGVRVRLAAQATAADRVRLAFVVADTGVGMSRSQLALIFGRERVRADGEGRGLGLAISLKLARLMGAQLTARSELGQGSMFSLTLEAPIASAHGRSAA